MWLVVKVAKTFRNPGRAETLGEFCYANNGRNGLAVVIEVSTRIHGERVPMIKIALSIVLVACLLPSSLLGQETPFVKYPAGSASILKRLHGKNAKNSAPGKLAFRPDYPGGFKAWQRDARTKLTELLGINQMIRAVGAHVPQVRLGKSIRESGYLRRLCEIETEPGVKIPFWLLTPNGRADKPRPIAICAHGHDTDGWNTYAGVYRDAAHRTSTQAKDGDVGVQAVNRGFVVLVPATRGLADVASIPDPKGRHGNRKCRAQLIHCLLAGRTPVGERVWDTQRLLDWALKNLKDVDPKKVLMVGNSGGGVMTVYVAALDERITVAVPSCSFTSYTSSTGFIFHCDCCLIPRVQVELADMADIGALTAPRALLAVHGRKDGLHSHSDVTAAMNRVRLIYAFANAPKAFRQEWGESGHKFYPDIMWPFIDFALADKW
jgi:hypothetical protein